VQFANKLFGKKQISLGIVGLSLLPKGISIAISKYNESNELRLVHCEFIATDQPPDLTLALAGLFQLYPLDRFDCHLVLTLDNYRHINIEAPPVADNELAEAIRWKIQELIDFPVDKAVIDYFSSPPTGRVNSGKTLDIIASPMDMIKNQVELCNKANLNIKVIDIQETSLRNLAALLPENERGVAILYLQDSNGMIILQKQATIYLSRKFNTGIDKLGLNENTTDNDRAKTEQSSLALEIQRSLDYVESVYGIPPFSGLAVIPIAQNTQSLLEILNDHHGITARIMDLSTILDSDIMLDDLTQSLCAPVIGATWRYVVEKLCSSK
jgi:MSHA biogenesis protein MshI